MRVIHAPEDPDWHGVIVGEIADIPNRDDIVFTTDENGRLVDKATLRRGPFDLDAAIQAWDDALAQQG